MRKVDAYLSRKAQAVWPTAIVWKDEPNGNGDVVKWLFILEREGFEDILLGNQFPEARSGLEALLASERSKRANKGAEAM